MPPKKRECPVHWVPLEPRTIEVVRAFDVVADVCPTCQGVFLDKGEIKRITGHDQLHDLLTKHVGYDSDSQRVCPSCGSIMDMEDADGTKVDVCLTCFGVWLDAGELEQLRAKPGAAFDPSQFSESKRVEVQRARQIEQRDRRHKWTMFLYRLRGADLFSRR
jgi:Zn-finger nucleic acid-binding protein